ncbi:MAG: hypothetical protein IKS15_05295 [Opitutales bacterium]|nr:hypothetical protein [Opitutales bacterium]
MKIFKTSQEKPQDSFSEKLSKDLLASQKIMAEAAQTAAHRRVETAIAQSLYGAENKRKKAGKI